MPFGLRWLSARNRETRRRLNRETADMDHTLLDAAQRLRPFHKMQAHHYQEQREAVRKPLLEAREERREIDRRLIRTRIVEPPKNRWPGQFFLRQPAHYITIPLNTWHLWQVGRSIKSIHTSLEEAAAQQQSLHQITQALEQAATTLHTQTLPALSQTLQSEKAAGLGRTDPYDEQLHHLRQRTANLTGSLRAGPAPEDRQTDKLALELEAITTAAAKLQDEVGTIRRRRVALDEQRRQALHNHNTLLQNLSPNRVPDNLAPIIDHIDTLLDQAITLRQQHEFDKGEACLALVAQFTELNWRLYETGKLLDHLTEIQQVSPLNDRIKATRNQWPSLVNQSHQLTQPNTDNVAAGIHACSETAVRIQKLAQQILAEHQQILNQVEGRANNALDTLAASWANLQAVLPLTQPDPLAESYHALWPKREAARGVPELLENFIVDSANLTRQINATLNTLQDQLRYVQETLGRLPKILAEAQQMTEEWRSLQKLAERLAALRANLENLSQETFAVNTREEVNNRLAAFHQQAEEVAQVQEELRFEAHEIGRLDKIIRDNWEAIQDNPMGLSEAKINRAVKMTDTQYERALSAERCQDARAALEKCLSYVENLALN